MKQTTIDKVIRILHIVQFSHVVLSGLEMLELLHYLGQRNMNWTYNYDSSVPSHEYGIISVTGMKMAIEFQKIDRYTWFIEHSKDSELFAPLTIPVNEATAA